MLSRARSSYILAALVLIATLSELTDGKSFGSNKSKHALKQTEASRRHQDSSSSESAEDDRSGRQVLPVGTYPLHHVAGPAQHPVVIQNSGTLQLPQHQQAQQAIQYQTPQTIAYILATGVIQPTTIIQAAPAPQATSNGQIYQTDLSATVKEQKQPPQAQAQNPWLELALGNLAEFALHPFLGETAGINHQIEQGLQPPHLPISAQSPVSISRPLSQAVAGPNGESESKAEGDATAGPGASALALPQAISIVGPGGVAIASAFGNANAIGGSVSPLSAATMMNLAAALGSPPSAPGSPPSFKRSSVGQTGYYSDIKQKSSTAVNQSAYSAQTTQQTSPFAASSTNNAADYTSQLLPYLLQQFLHRSAAAQSPILIASSVGGVPVVYQAYRIQ